MSKDRIFLSSPSIGELEKKYAIEAIDNNEISSYGSNIARFEELLETYLGIENRLVSLINGTSSLHMALILADVKKDDIVICQTFTFIATANPIRYQLATPVFIDSEKDTWNMCPDNLEIAIQTCLKEGKKPKAIIVVHSYGMPAKIDKIKEISIKYNIILIEDAAEALGSSYKGKMCGTFGDFGIISFNGNKIISTSNGGVLICKNQEIKEKAGFLSSQARDKAHIYQHSFVGYNYKMNNISAGIGRGQMKRLKKNIQLRRSVNKFYSDLFKKIRGIEVLSEPTKDYYSNHWLTCVLINKELSNFTSRDLYLAFEKANIESRPLWKPMHTQPMFSDY